MEYSYIFYPDSPIVDILPHFLNQMSMLTCPFSICLCICVHIQNIFITCVFIYVCRFVHTRVVLSLLKVSCMTFYILQSISFSKNKNTVLHTGKF